MSSKETKRIGLLVGSEKEWPDAFIKAVANRPDVTAELVKIDATFLDEPVNYDVIVDRISHDIPYYRAYLKYALLQGAYVINNPFTWSADSKFFGSAMVRELGFKTPRTAILPNKEVEIEANPDTFRNLNYPMDWEAIIEYVGVPAIFKDVHTGGRPPVYRVSDVDDLLQRYDESGTRTKILQQIIDSDTHVHCLVIGQEKVLPLPFDLGNGRYLPEPTAHDADLHQYLRESALKITKAFGYDINMVEFVIKDGDPFVINGSNPAPIIDTTLMTPSQFSWCVTHTVELAVNRAHTPLTQHTLLA